VEAINNIFIYKYIFTYFKGPVCSLDSGAFAKEKKKTITANVIGNRNNFSCLALISPVNGIFRIKTEVVIMRNWRRYKDVKERKTFENQCRYKPLNRY